MITMFDERIDYQGDLEPVLKSACKAFGVGNLINFKLIEKGVEDFNVGVETTTGKYVCKIFNKTRTKSDINRLISVYEKVSCADVGFPRLCKKNDGSLLFENNKLSMVFTNFIDGKTYFDTKSTPKGKDLVDIVRMASKINKIKFDNLSYLDDPWGIPNIKKHYQEIGKFITDKYALDFICKSIKLYEAIPINKLPHAFVHGDIITSNVIKGVDGKCYIIDYSAANLAPRIQELAVMTTNLISGNGCSLEDNAKTIFNTYNKFTKLTDIEQEYYLSYCLAETAVIYMAAFREKLVNGLSQEVKYWLNMCYEDMKSYSK